MNVGSLFSGIGGFDLGLERAGMRVVWQCEADPFCRRVLARHWPGVPCYPDIRQVRGLPMGPLRSGSEVLAAPVDVLCGGFPCQDISLAGRGAGIEGARSGLWGEYARLIRELRPRYVIVENVAALLSRGLGTVLGDLAACGYDAEWDCIPAAAVGAPHRRDRVWLIAYPDGSGRIAGQPHFQARESDIEGCGTVVADPDQRGGPGRQEPEGSCCEVADPQRGGRQGWPAHEGRGSADGQAPERREGASQPAGRGEAGRALADAVGEGELQPQGSERQERRRTGDSGEQLADADSAARTATGSAAEAVSGPGTVERPGRRGGVLGELQDADGSALQPWRVGGRVAQAGGSEWWAVEPPVGRVAHGVPDRLDQLAALGNALVPQIAEWLGTQILDYERAERKPGVAA